MTINLNAINTYLLLFYLVMLCRVNSERILKLALFLVPRFHQKATSKALRKVANSVFCSFAKIRIIRLSKFEINLEIINSYLNAKVLRQFNKNINKSENDY